MTTNNNVKVDKENEKTNNPIKKKISKLEKGDFAIIKGDIYINNYRVSKVNGKRYKSISVEDSSGKIYATIMDDEKLYTGLVPGHIYGEVYLRVKSIPDSKNKYYSVFVEKIEEKTERDDTFGVVNEIELKNRFRQILNSIKHPGFRELLINVFKREDVKSKFFEAPASEKAGYSFKSGLLARTIRLTILCKAIANIYKAMNFNIDDTNTNLNEEALVTASILLEVGKINIYSMNNNGSISKTDVGEMFDTKYLTNKILIEEFSKTTKLIDADKMLLEHMIASTFRKIASSENVDSFVLPKTKEAYVLGLMSYMDRKLADVEFLERTNGYADFVEFFGKKICLKSFSNSEE
ncbi:hypothetical protein C4D27_12815 [Clostridium perfringens]